MQSLLQWVNTLKDKDVYSNTSLIDTTKYDNLAFWWFLRYRFFFDLSIVFESGKKQYRRSLGKFILSRLSRLYILSVILFSFISKLFFPMRVKRKRAEKKVFVTFNTVDWRGFRDIKTGKYLRGHSLFGPILRKLSAKTGEVEFFSSYPFGYSFFSFVKMALDARISRHLGRFTPLESYLTGRSLIQTLRARELFSAELSKMKANNKRKHTFQYHGKDVFTLFQADFEYYYKVYLPLMVQYYELSLDLLEKENPDLVLVENEYVGFERALIYACQKKQIPSLAQQHGLITKDHIGYLYAKEDISRQEFSHFPYCPLPSCTSVIGPSFQDILTKISSYPKSKVVVSGQPRYDVFYFANRIYDRSVFLKRNKLDSKKKLVLLATQPFHLERLREEFFVNIIQSVMPIDGVQIVVKPHPNESEKWFSEKLNSLETDVLVLPPKSDTIEAIFACDVFLSVNSTTILEALIMDKPVVIVNLSKLTEPLPWVKEGAAIGVYEAEKIRGVIEDVLAKGKTDRQLSKRRSDFVYKYLYKIDGKATDRVISLMRRLAK